jgi:hypothetical protein
VANEVLVKGPIGQSSLLELQRRERRGRMAGRGRRSSTTAKKATDNNRLSGRKRTASSRSTAGTSSASPTAVVKLETPEAAVADGTPTTSAQAAFDPFDYSSPIPVGHKIYAKLKESKEYRKSDLL